MTLTKSVRFFALFLAAAGVDLRATPAEDYAALTKGIQKIPLKGSAGAVSVEWRASIPLILSPK